MSSGYFPLAWKTDFITPIHKRGNKKHILNYRPFLNISVIPKLFNAITANRLIDAVCSKIIEEQHGFMQGRFTLTNLIIFSQ